MSLRDFEEKVINFFVESIPALKDYTKNIFEGYDKDENVGMYILMNDIFKYFEDCVKDGNEQKTKEFLVVLNQFRDKFQTEYEQCGETMDNFIGVAFYEDVVDGFNDADTEFVYKLFDERLKAEYNYYKDSWRNDLVAYIEYLLKDKNLQLDIKFVDHDKYKFINEVDGEETVNITGLISLTKKCFYVLDNSFCYFGVLDNNNIKLKYKDTLPLYLFKKVDINEFK